MLIGAHVSTAGGLDKAVARGVEIEARAIQIFNQSPRMWRPTAYNEADFAAFREAMAEAKIGAVVIHAVYLINCATDDPDLRQKSLASLTHSLYVGDQIGAAGVVLHAGSAKDGPVDVAISRAGEVISEALDATDCCPLLLEDTAGAGGTLGRSFQELAALIDSAGGDKRLGLCLDSCHLLASGYDVRSAQGLEAVLQECDELVGLDRLGALHVNDSQTPLGSNRDRHCALGTGEIGAIGCAAYLSEPRFEGLPVIFEGPGADGKAPTITDIRQALALREQGLAARGT
ncbi:MAG: deoxyribonuclease IV [Solirubrobacterales bacterium]|nr:deoxyribonuclease IV [Solirubrobacterales bacterium]